jgi:hypothetical protein
MQRFVVLLLLVVFILGFGLPTLAQDNKDTTDPFTPADNECYDGGTLEGKCNTLDVNGDYVVDQRDTDWMWTCGWYLARFNDGRMRRLQVPEGCRIILGIFIHHPRPLTEGSSASWPQRCSRNVSRPCPQRRRWQRRLV